MANRYESCNSCYLILLMMIYWTKRGKDYISTQNYDRRRLFFINYVFFDIERQLTGHCYLQVLLPFFNRHRRLHKHLLPIVQVQQQVISPLIRQHKVNNELPFTLILLYIFKSIPLSFYYFFQLYILDLQLL